MQVPVEIIYRNVDKSEALETRIREKIAKLNSKFERMISCRVVVEKANHQQNSGNSYSVHIDVTMPGGELVVSEHSGKDRLMDEKVYAAMNSAFSAIERQLERFKERTRD
jgi:ribosomal subunit interface protein